MPLLIRDFKLVPVLLNYANVPSNYDLTKHSNKIDGHGFLLSYIMKKTYMLQR